jgi:hypothetical protein
MTYQQPNLAQIYGMRPEESDSKIHETPYDDSLQQTIAFQERIRQLMRLRLQYFCYHIRWICDNIINLDTLQTRKDIASFGTKHVQKLRTYANHLLKTKFQFQHTIIHDKSSIAYMSEILKILHLLTGIVEREYVAPLLTTDYLKHIQAMGKTLLDPHWALGLQAVVDPSKTIVQEISQLVIPVFFNLKSLRRLLDEDYHNAQLYKCLSYVQKYHKIAIDSTTNLHDQYVPFLKDVVELFDLISQMSQDTSSNLIIPKYAITLWARETLLALDMFDLYKDEL